MGRKRHRMVERRRTLGLSQEGLAEAMTVETSTVARWERGETTPQPWHRPRLAEVLKVTVEEVGEMLAADVPAIPADERLGYAAQHRGSVDIVTVAHLRQRVYDLDACYITMPPTSLLADAGECLNQAAHLRAAATASRVQRELHTIEAEAAILMGQLVWDASQRRDHATARAYLTRAVDTARESGSPVAEGWALLRTAIVALYGENDPEAGLALATRTAETARSSHVLSGLAMLHAAEAYAMLQQRRDTEQALGEGQALFGRVNPSDAAVELFSPTDYYRMAGSCYLFLGDPRRAQITLESAANGLQSGSKAHAIVLGNLSLAHLRQQKIDEAVAMLQKAIDVVERTRGGGGLTIVFRAVRELQPWRSDPAVQEVSDRLLDLVAG